MQGHTHTYTSRTVLAHCQGRTELWELVVADLGRVLATWPGGNGNSSAPTQISPPVNKCSTNAPYTEPWGKTLVELHKMNISVGIRNRHIVAFKPLKYTPLLEVRLLLCCCKVGSRPFKPSTYFIEKVNIGPEHWPRVLSYSGILLLIPGALRSINSCFAQL
jgi:hypothetical protein